ncbi:hypothetical protein [Amycolatopsis magusensis]|uniref:hypothetical protein n=1 Tax=Amycolatopsis magusensis TaxID=882444 RepID=UPI0037B09C19
MADADPWTGDEKSTNGQDALTVAEYVSVRAEILKLIELQSQLVSLTVVTVGAALGVAVQTKNPNLAFIYSLLALILGIMWLNHAHAISRCAEYLSQHFEPRFGNRVLDWERFVRRNPLRFGMLGYWGIRAVFMGSSALACLVGWSLTPGGGLQVVAGIVASLLCASTVLLFICWREPSPRKLRKDEDA